MQFLEIGALKSNSLLTIQLSGFKIWHHFNVLIVVDLEVRGSDFAGFVFDAERLRKTENARVIGTCFAKIRHLERHVGDSHDRNTFTRSLRKAACRDHQKDDDPKYP